MRLIEIRKKYLNQNKFRRETLSGQKYVNKKRHFNMA